MMTRRTGRSAVAGPATLRGVMGVRVTRTHRGRGAVEGASEGAGAEASTELGARSRGARRGEALQVFACYFSLKLLFIFFCNYFS